MQPRSYYSKPKKKLLGLLHRQMPDLTDYQLIKSQKCHITLLIGYAPEKNAALQKKNLENLVEEIEEQLEKISQNNDFPTSLENLLNQLDEEKYLLPPENKDKNILYPDFTIKEKYPKRESSQTPTNKDPKSGAKVEYLPSFMLPHGNGWRALGMYDPQTHTIYVANDLAEHEKDFVYYHEVAHALGIHDEMQADNYATRQVGYSIR